MTVARQSLSLRVPNSKKHTSRIATLCRRFPSIIPSFHGVTQRVEGYLSIFKFEGVEWQSISTRRLCIRRYKACDLIQGSHGLRMPTMLESAEH